MKLEVRSTPHVSIIKLKESRMVFPHTETFASAVEKEMGRGCKNIVVDLSEVGYLDSAAHGVLFDLYRRLTERGGTIKLAGLQPRVEEMASIVGFHKIFEIFPDEAQALESLVVEKRAEPT